MIQAVPHFQRMTLVTVIATLALIGLGATVRTTGSGLGCPDWPLCHGEFLPPVERAPVIEWSHRALAATVGVLIVGQAAWIAASFRGVRRMLAVSALTLPLLLVQALLGREAVVRELPPAVVAVHMVSAQLLLALLVAIAVWAARGSGDAGTASTERRVKHRRASLVVVVLVGLTMVLGAYMLATGAGFACSGWPGCAQAPVPFVEGDRLQHVHWLHRAMAGGTFIGIAWLAWRARATAEGRVPVAIRLLGVLFALQVLLGAANLWFDFAEPVRIAHLLMGSVIWATAVALFVASERPHRGPGRTGVANDRPPMSHKPTGRTQISVWAGSPRGPRGSWRKS